MFAQSICSMQRVLVMSLLACCALGVSTSAAQDDERPLIVVANASDANCVRQIGGKLCQVETLFTTNDGSTPSDYSSCDTRLLTFTSFQLFVCRTGVQYIGEQFWSDRLLEANPRGKILQLPAYKLETDTQCRIRHAKEIHRTLSSIMPAHRMTFDSNLRAELYRLRSLDVLYQLAAND